MKRTAALLLLLLISFSYVTAEEHPICWVQYADLLPLWEPSYKSTQVEGCVQYFGYTNVDSEMVENYLETLEQQGFNCVRSEYNYALFREDCIILIREYMTNTYEIALWRSSGFRGKMISNDLIAMIHERDILCSLDISPERLFQGTGMQLFVCVRDARSDEPSLLNREFYLVGNGKCLRLDFLDLICADLDQDGTPELLTVEWGPTSGVFTLAFKVYGVQNGIPYLQTGWLDSLERGRFALIEENGKAYFEYAQQYYNKETKMTEYKHVQFFEVILQESKIVFHHNEVEDWPFH